MLWNGGMLGLGFANFDSSLALPALAWVVAGCVIAWVLEESTGFWNAVLED
jgi:hypothetical protein